MRCITVSLVEDESHTAEMLTRLLEAAPGFNVVSCHAAAEDALALVPGLKPRVVLVDLKLPKLSGVECIRRLKRSLPEVLCIVITQFEDSDLLFEALQAGADGYLLKRTSGSEILEAVRAVVSGGGAMSPSICRRVLEYFQNSAPTADAQQVLSGRELEVLRLARRGKRPKEIASAMKLSYETIRTHFRNIYRKLHVHSLRAAVEKSFDEQAHRPR